MTSDTFEGQRPRGSLTIRRLYNCAWLALDSLCGLVPVKRCHVALVVRLDAIGDFFIWMQSGAVDVSRYARSSGRRVVLLANRLWADYARGTGLWDEVVGVDPRRLMRDPLYRLRTLLRIRRLGAEVLVQPRAARVLLQEDAIARVAGAALRIGNRGTLLNMTEWQRRWGNRFYDRLIAVDEKKSTHETLRNAQFVQALTGGSPTPFEFATPRDADRTAAPRTVVVALGAGQIGRVWPVEKLAGLLEQLRSSHPSLHIVLLGVDADRAVARRLEQLAGVVFVNRVGETCLQEYIDIIARACLVVCNDSSAYHIAMAYRKTVLCFLGGGHYGWFAPYPESDASHRAAVLSVPMDCFWCNWDCRYPRAADGAFRCVASISVADAVASMERLLAA
jgi:ADP-heptose:LPS heptosyltransferase